MFKKKYKGQIQTKRTFESKSRLREQNEKVTNDNTSKIVTFLKALNKISKLQ